MASARIVKQFKSLIQRDMKKKTSFVHQGYALSSNDVSRMNGTANNGTAIKKNPYIAASQHAREIKP